MIYDLYEISYDDIPADAEVPELEVGLTLLKAVFDPEVGMIAEKALEKLQPYIHQEAYQKFVQVSLSYLKKGVVSMKTNEVSPEFWSAVVQVILDDKSLVAEVILGSDGIVLKCRNELKSLFPPGTICKLPQDEWKDVPVLIDGKQIGTVLARRFCPKQTDREILEKEARTDSLTGLLNRRGMSLAYERIAAKQANSAGCRSGAVVFCDVNHFKKVNDALGHRRGDEVLVRIAILLKSVFREGDEIGRYGGDEFLLLLPGCPMNCVSDRMTLVNKKLQQEFAGQGIPLETLSLSWGMVDMAESSTWEELVAAADREYYCGKIPHCTTE